MFIGYNEESKAYKLLDPITGKLVISRNVTFNEDASWNWSKGTSSTQRAILEDDENTLKNHMQGIHTQPTFNHSTVKTLPWI